MDAADTIQKFINGYGFERFIVYSRTDEWLAIDTKEEDESAIIALKNRLCAWNLQCNIWEHYIEIYIGDDDRFKKGDK